MTHHTGEQWSWQAGIEPDTRWCRACQEWVIPDFDTDEDGKYSEWCCFCGGDLVDDELPREEEDDDLPVG